MDIILEEINACREAAERAGAALAEAERELEAELAARAAKRGEE